jgi:protein-glucosylgalactosylhydroxylysine glucosidase
LIQKRCAWFSSTLSDGRSVSAEGQNVLYTWLRENPHRLHLGRVALRLTKSGGGEAQVADITDIEQKLDLWTGVLTSRFKFEGKPVMVRTAAHQAFDLLAVSIESPLIAEGQLAARFAFPYGSPSMQAADWKQPEKHKTELTKQTASRVDLHRQFDAHQYFTAINWNGRADFTAEERHHFVLAPSKRNSRLEFTVAFSTFPLTAALPNAGATFAESAAHWNRFWTEGGAIELAGSRDHRAAELERRIVLSQYLTAIQCAGSMPPQETGLTVNSWYGKFHLEMHWWHAAHFALWNRTPLLEKSLGWYDRMLPAARDLARSQGYAGVRWPKMVGPAGADSPSPIGPLLIWQQPHPIFYAELCYRTHPNRQTLERFRPIVFQSAEFMASFAHYDQHTLRYVLGPPVIPAQENHPPRETWNPTFELAVGVEDCAAMARAPWSETQSEVGRRDLQTLAAAREGRRLPGARKLPADLYRSQSRPPINARRAGRVAWRWSRPRNYAPHAPQNDEGMEVGADLGLGLSDDGDDSGAIGRNRNGDRRAAA